MPNSEFALHILKSSGPGAEPVYTIGVWQKTATGSELRAICHVEPIERALAAIRRELKPAGYAPSKRRPHADRTSALVSKSSVFTVSAIVGGILNAITRFRTKLGAGWRKPNERPVSPTSSASPPARRAPVHHSHLHNRRSPRLHHGWALSRPPAR